MHLRLGAQHRRGYNSFVNYIDDIARCRVKSGSSHTEQARAAIGEGVRQRFQERRELSSLIVYSLDEALRLAEEAEAAIVIGVDAAEVEAKMALARDAMRTASELVNGRPSSL
jgi:hypothetical protein